MKDILLKMENITYSISGTSILKGVDFTLMRGEVHALVGENGAGKSTLMTILGGLHRPDAGTVCIEGQQKTFRSVRDAFTAGIGFVPQRILLVPHLTIAENILLGQESLTACHLLDKQSQNRQVQRFLDGYNLGLCATTPVSALQLFHKQMVQILKAVYKNVKILILDEATASLPETQVCLVHQMIRELKQKGVGIVYISHRMQEMLKVADRITVLRDGRHIKTYSADEATNSQLMGFMIGKNLKSHYVRDFHVPGDVLLEVQDLCSHGVLRDVSFSVRKGEILGLVGRGGSGRSLLAKCLFGLEKIDSGKILMENRQVEIRSPRDAILRHIALVPEYRDRQGLFEMESVQFNTTFVVLEKFMRGMMTNRKKETDVVRHYIESLAIKSASPKKITRMLSGGNQQKVVIAKWLATDPVLLILDEPTRGMDVVSKSEIYRILDELALKGVAVLMISSDISEAVNMCDRIVVINEGRINACLDRGKFNQLKIAQLIVGMQQPQVDTGVV